MELTLDEVLKGKAAIIKDNEYRTAEAYITPFIERMSKYTNDFRIQAKLPDCLSVDQVNGNDTWYSRVWVQAVMPSDLCFENHSEVVGMIYALDTRKPIVKIYRGNLNRACLNLCIFDPAFLNVQELEPEKAINYKPVIELMERTSDTKALLTKLSNTEVPYDKRLIEENLGRWVRNSINACYDNGFGKVKLSPSTVIDAYKLLYENKESPYYVKPGEVTTMFDVYNSFTELITNDGNKENKSIAKDILTKPDKTLLLRQVLEI